MTGPGGSGKSRLALELCLERRDAWRAGFLSRDEIEDLSFWQAWRPNRPTLLIADYAAAYAEVIGELARCLRAKTTRPRFPVRLLLIDRDKGEWFARFLGKGMSERLRSNISAPMVRNSLSKDYPKQKHGLSCSLSLHHALLKVIAIALSNASKQ
jgi:hypothetical protein